MGKSSFNELTTSSVADLSATVATSRFYSMESNIQPVGFTLTISRTRDQYSVHISLVIRLLEIFSLKNGCDGDSDSLHALNDAGVQQLLLIGVTQDGGNLLPAASVQGRVALR